MGCGETETQRGSSRCEAGGAQGKAVPLADMETELCGEGRTSVNVDTMITHQKKMLRYLSQTSKGRIITQLYNGPCFHECFLFVCVTF